MATAPDRSIQAKEARRARKTRQTRIDIPECEGLRTEAGMPRSTVRTLLENLPTYSQKDLFCTVAH